MKNCCNGIGDLFPSDAGIPRSMVASDFRRKGSAYTLGDLGDGVAVTPRSAVPKLKATTSLANIKNVEQARQYASGSFHVAKDKADQSLARQRERYELAANAYAAAYRLGEVKYTAGANVLASGMTAARTTEAMIAGIKQGV